MSGLEKIPEEPVFAVASFQTAYSMLKTKKDSILDNFIKLKNRCNLLVVDEAHMSLAETYKTAIELFSGSRCKVIGLTATPEDMVSRKETMKPLSLFLFMKTIF